jgi:hypothetical protein
MSEHQNAMGHYVIRGGGDGRERLRLLSGVMRHTLYDCSIALVSAKACPVLTRGRFVVSQV